MGILSNTVSIAQFQVLGDNLATMNGTIIEQGLARMPFQPIDHNADEQSVGWVRLSNAEDSDFTDGSSLMDHYVAFSLRKDQRKVSGAVLRRHYEKACSDFLAANPGLQRVPKQKREELREAVKGALLAKTLPVPTTIDAVWDTEANLITLTTLSPKGFELFEVLFKSSFEGLRMVQYHPYARAEALVSDALRSKLTAANQAGSQAVLDLIKDNAWLGQDFLRWLLYRTAEASGEYRVNQPGTAIKGEGFVAYINDKLTLMANGEGGTQKVAVSGPQDNFREARTALAGGKQISEGTLYLEQQENTWKLTLKGESFHFASFKAPAVKLEKDNQTDDANEKQAVFYERMHVLEEGLQLFNSLFATFLEKRLSAEWSLADKEILDWLNE